MGGSRVKPQLVTWIVRVFRSGVFTASKGWENDQKLVTLGTMGMLLSMILLKTLNNVVMSWSERFQGVPTIGQT